MLPLVPCRCQLFVEGPEGRALAASPMYPALRRALVVHLMMLREFLLLEPQDVFRWGGRPAGAGCCARTGRQAYRHLWHWCGVPSSRPLWGGQANVASSTRAVQRAAICWPLAVAFVTVMPAVACIPTCTCPCRFGSMTPLAYPPPCRCLRASDSVRQDVLLHQQPQGQAHVPQ